MLKRMLTKLLNNMRLHNKFLIMYFFCVIIPLVITDSVVLLAVYRQEYNERLYSMDYVAGRYQSDIQSVVNYEANIARAVCENPELNQFLDKTYTDSFDYYVNYYSFISNSFFETINGIRSDTINIYVDNPTIGNGRYFRPLSTAINTEWYKRFWNLNTDECLLIYYDETADGNIENKRKMIYVRKMQLYDSKYDKLVMIEINSTDMQIQLLRESTDYAMYICCGDYVAFSGYGDTMKNVNPDSLASHYRMGTHHIFSTHGTKLDIYVFSNELLITSVLYHYLWVIIVFLIATLILPLFIMSIIEQSISSRVSKLGAAISGDNEDKFQPITTIEGNDEISSLMKNYNNIVAINNRLINILYRDKLKEQENDLARKNAELLALQSQINPHFMFNALESIRMHSILKGEDETAEMVEKLAVMERQNVEWGNDLVTIKKETESIKAYLYLQSYRFGDRLSFDIDIEEDCELLLIPKLTLVTFVENACVHGIESKSSAGWIFVRVYKKDSDLCMEVEDTGGGMTEEEVAAMTTSIENVTIDMIKKKKHVGILNACLRLKMHTENAVKITIDSEEGVGMCVLIRVPLDRLKSGME
ncbi:MAG: histidine kinase [Clostridiales bacterium]|nr:histidine kinase [Clostridiales bacterium]